MRSGKRSRICIGHEPWPLQPAGGEIQRKTIGSAASLTVEGKPLLHFARTLDVRIWPPEILSE